MEYLVVDNPETNLSTEHCIQFVDIFNCKFKRTVDNTVNRKSSSLDNVEIYNNVRLIKMELCKIETVYRSVLQIPHFPEIQQWA